VVRLSHLALLVGALVASATTGACSVLGAADTGAGAATTDVPSTGAGPRGSVGAAPACASSPALAFDPVTCASRAAPDALDAALAQVALARCTAGLSAAELSLSKLDATDPRMLASARGGQHAPIALPAFGVATAAALDAAIGSRAAPVTRAIVAAASLRETPITACANVAWYAPADVDAPLAQALAEVRGVKAEPDEVRGIPLELQRALVPIVRALAAEDQAVGEARRGASPELLRVASVIPSWILGVRRFEWSPSVPVAFEAIDVAAIARAAASLALVVESANLARFAGMKLEAFDLATPFGAIVLRGPASDTWNARDAKRDDDAPAFLLDTGGDDTYLGPVASSTLSRRISVAVDLGGRDVYAYREERVDADAVGARMPSDGAGRAEDGRTLSQTGRQGSAVLGVGLLLDLGDAPDTYRSLLGSQGAASHGVGVLYDAGGNDSYEAEGFSQGAAAWGIGLLLDAGGDDRHTLYQAGQGYGFTRGVGALVDRTGEDLYVANTGEPSLGGDRLYGSDQLPGPPTSDIAANHSFAQGCGAGHRPDGPDPGYPFPGGLGILRDATGYDRYVAGVFAQGVGFVQGLGMLLEGTGDDTYEGLFYAQGAAVHQGLALFADRTGTDRYDVGFPNQGASLGVANDLAVSVFFDANGNDEFSAPPLSLGAALANGFAVFANDGGNDIFRSGSASGFGSALVGDVASRRALMPTIGVFVKARGRGTYLVGGSPDERAGRAGRAWGESECKSEGPSAKCASVDEPHGRINL
jgi:hypothetical protein